LGIGQKAKLHNINYTVVETDLTFFALGASLMPTPFAYRMQHTQPSDIREILVKTSGGDYLSFAGGVPDPDFFPVALLSELAQKVLRDHPGRALQYGPTPGLLPLREKIAALMSDLGVATDSDHVQITSGAQQGIGLSGTILVDPGDTVLTERPTYSAALSALSLFRPSYRDVESDHEGPVIDQVRNCLNAERPVKLAYVIPNFQNPSGRLWSLERRAEFLAALAGSETLIVEDDPYGQLVFGDRPTQPIKAIDQDERVIYLGSFSKVLCPGLRVGWIVASSEILAQYNLAKQNHDLHTSAFDQELINAYLDESALQPQIKRLRESYAARCTAMLSALQETWPDGVNFTRPEGGMFTWVELPNSVNARELLAVAMQEKVSFIPGDGFFATKPAQNTLRLNFTAMGPEKIKRGIAILGRLVHQLLD
jgi:2-aminoadipate transaminase